MSDPTVCAVMLTADRQQMTDRAVRSFLAQDYGAKSLVIYDTGNAAAYLQRDPYWCQVRGPKQSIGLMRNAAIQLTGITDILIHFDSDDWSAPTRISDQVRLLVESGKQAVGYREMLFWRQPCLDVWHKEHNSNSDQGEAWFYSNTDTRYCLATSLCYWRKTWEAKPFPDAMIGSEREWLKGLDTMSVPGAFCSNDGSRGGSWFASCDEPQLIATIHGGNTVKNQISTTATNPDGSPMWKRVPQWDARVRSILEAA